VEVPTLDTIKCFAAVLTWIPSTYIQLLDWLTPQFTVLWCLSAWINSSESKRQTPRHTTRCFPFGVRRMRDWNLFHGLTWSVQKVSPYQWRLQSAQIKSPMRFASFSASIRCLHGILTVQITSHNSYAVQCVQLITTNRYGEKHLRCVNYFSQIRR